MYNKSINQSKRDKNSRPLIYLEPLSIQVEWLQEGADAHPVAPSHTFCPPLVKLPGTGSDQYSFVPAKQRMLYRI